MSAFRFMSLRFFHGFLVFCFCLIVVACDNSPYPSADSSEKILYTSFSEAPKTLDPAVAYTTNAHQFTGVIYGALLEYHYLKRPYTLIPSFALDVPEAQPLSDGRVRYQFELRKELYFQKDEAFELLAGKSNREILASDVAFQLMRVADPGVNSPVIGVFSKIDGFKAFSEKLTKAREDEAFKALRIDRQYEKVGGISGIALPTSHTLEITLSEAYPQILYWFAMKFTSPMPWEAVVHYDGEEGRPHLRDHPVGAGPYMMNTYDKQSRIILEKNPDWYGLDPAHTGAPGTVYPSEGEEIDFDKGWRDPDYVGRTVPFIDRIEFRREKESIPRFNKFLQGYYDFSGIIQESFDQIVRDDELSEGMVAKGARLERSVSPDIFYIGFNMADPMIGHPAGERGKKVRQAMSLVIDTQEFTRLFTNGRGVPAQSPLPPGIFGYEEEFENPYRTVDVEKAKRLLAEAGYENGIDPATGEPLKLTIDSPDTSSSGQLRFQFYVDAWRSIGIDVEIAATNYNQFQAKIRNGAYQIFQWGWVADYPDPENFMFLLEGSHAKKIAGGENTANFQNARFDQLFYEMKNRPNDEQRLRIIQEMKAIIAEERPWIELLSSENYALYNGWLKNVKPFGISFPFYKYWDLDPELRTEKREAWNQPVLWPVYVLIFIFVLILVPGIRTFYRERQ